MSGRYMCLLIWTVKMKQGEFMTRDFTTSEVNVVLYAQLASVKINLDQDKTGF